jgi:hypothetical protein
MFGGLVFQQTLWLGMPMCTNCAPLPTDLSLHSCEAHFKQEILKKNEKKLVQSFNFAFSYIDDVLLLNNFYWLSLSHHFQIFTIDNMTWLTVTEHLYRVTNDHRYGPLVLSTSRSFPHSWFFTRFVTRVTRRVPLVQQKLHTLLEHLN